NDHGITVELSATPATGWHFAGWSGAATGTINPVSVTMDGDKTVSSTFAINTYSLTVSTVGQGSVAKSPDQASYDHGSTVELTATPATGWHFAGWSGAVSGTTNPVSVTIDGDKTVTATFAIDTYTITATAGDSGSISPSGAVTVSNGANQSFTITPNPCYHLADVLVDGVSVGAVGSHSFTNVTANHTITASFAANPLPAAVTGLTAQQMISGNDNDGT